MMNDRWESMFELEYTKCHLRHRHPLNIIIHTHGSVIGELVSVLSQKVPSFFTSSSPSLSSSPEPSSQSSSSPPLSSTSSSSPSPSASLPPPLSSSSSPSQSPSSSNSLEECDHVTDVWSPDGHGIMWRRCDNVTAVWSQGLYCEGLQNKPDQRGPSFWPRVARVRGCHTYMACEAFWVWKKKGFTNEMDLTPIWSSVLSVFWTLLLIRLPMLICMYSMC